MGKKSQMDDEERAEKPPVEYITLKVRDGNVEALYKVKKKTPMRSVMKLFGVKRNRQANSFRFLIDGNRIHPDSTAEDLELVNGDIIDALTEQTGGAF